MTQLPYISTDTSGAIPLTLVNEKTFPQFLASLSEWQRQWVSTQQFTGKPETALLLPDPESDTPQAVVGTKEQLHAWSIAHAPLQLPAGRYKITNELDTELHTELALGASLAQYLFTRYRKAEIKRFTYIAPNEAVKVRALAQLDAITLTRDLINTPTNDMGPQELAAAAEHLGQQTGGNCRIIRGQALIEQNYPAIHAVGRASASEPCLIDITWGNPDHPKVTLVGKGVCFDTGGLDLKPYSSMKLMKKDMGGAALVLGLAKLLLTEKLPIRLRVLIPAVENSVSANAFRPQDVIPTRKGLTVEIGSTDAEGRVILCDALTEADSESPDLLIDVATLTGAARTALGTELPAMFSLNRDTGNALVDTALATQDPMWQLPLWENYERYLKTPIADITNSPNYGYAGSITAALYLKKFVSQAKDWIHIDTMAWNIDPQPGRPIGGEALGLRSLTRFIKERYSKK